MVERPPLMMRCFFPSVFHLKTYDRSILKALVTVHSRIGVEKKNHSRTIEI